MGPHHRFVVDGPPFTGDCYRPVTCCLSPTAAGTAVLPSGFMTFRRRGLAWMALLVLSAAGVIASAPQLHGHPVSLSDIASAEWGGSGPAMGSPRHSDPSAPDECLACQISTLALTLQTAHVFATPVAQSTSAFVSPTVIAAASPLRATRGRAPPAS
jgi:hypothetical protein